MNITIAERLHPFSHQSGTPFILPRTTLVVRVFPTRLFISDLSGKIESFSLAFDFAGPLKEFTAELDLEHQELCVFGKTRKGFMRYLLSAKEDGVWLTMEKIPEEKTVCTRSFPPHEVILSKGEKMLVCLPLKGAEELAKGERLSLGMHKSQDFDMVRRRGDFKEIFPHWLALGSLVRGEESDAPFPLLTQCRATIENRQRESVLEAFEALFLAHFEGVLVPRSLDTDYQGIQEQTPPPQANPTPLLTEGSRLIRSLFIQERENGVALLPCLPPEFHSGRMTGVKTADGHRWDFEWTKKSLRTVLLQPCGQGELSLILPKGIRSFRQKVGRQPFRKISVDSAGMATLLLEKDSFMQLDRFEG